MLLTLLISSCSTTHEVIGFATNAKDGASIRTSETVYIIEDFTTWHDTLNNKKVKALIKIKHKSTISKDDLYASKNNIFKQGRIGNNTTVKLIKIELIK